MDNGNGLNQETMHKMLRCMYRTCCSLCQVSEFMQVCILIQQYLYFSPSSFGYSDKTTVNRHAPIGIYGNGFKSGSMRLGKDAIVFSKSKRMSCVGMLSQTYLKEINANQIIVPIICFEHTDQNKYILYLMHEFTSHTSGCVLPWYSPCNTVYSGELDTWGLHKTFVLVCSSSLSLTSVTSVFLLIFHSFQVALNLIFYSL